MKITYLSHGTIKTGGYKHERHLAETLSDEFNNCSSCFEEIRFNKVFKGFFQWIALFFKSLFNAKGDVIITVSRLCWPVFFRNYFNNNKIILVVHNYDKNDGKPALFYFLLDLYFKTTAKNKNKYCVVVVSEYWKDFIKSKLKKDVNVFVIPNMMENARLGFYRDVIGKKSKMIHLGQWSDKIDKKAYRILIHKLNEAGIACYFSDNTGVEVKDFPVSYFQTHEGYLKQMALSEATVILNKIDEGWNRVAHESFLTGTQVIAMDKGGIRELIKKGNGYLVDSAEAAFSIIKEGNYKNIDENALQDFDISNSKKYFEPLNSWIKSK